MAANRGVGAGRTASSVGMMEGAFFVSRSDLLQWVNSLLQVSIAKVEQCASGAVYCQILDSCHPGSVSMRKVNWMAKSDHEFIPNYKVLQMAFDKNCIERHIDVDKLIRAKYQDNLEFLQFMKCYWEREGAGRRDYDPLPAREGRPLPPWARPLGNVGSVPTACKENLRPRPVPRVEAEASKRPVASGRSPAPRPGGAKSPSPRARATDAEAPASQPRGACGELEARLAVQQEELQELRGTLQGLERERDYYFRKLRDVEILCATQEAQMDPGLTAEKLLKEIQGILYATEDMEAEGAEEAAPLAEQ